jgi:hypothetical protein
MAKKTQTKSEVTHSEALGEKWNLNGLNKRGAKWIIVATPGEWLQMIVELRDGSVINTHDRLQMIVELRDGSVINTHDRLQMIVELRDGSVINTHDLIQDWLSDTKEPTAFERDTS